MCSFLSKLLQLKGQHQYLCKACRESGQTLSGSRYGIAPGSANNHPLSWKFKVREESNTQRKFKCTQTVFTQAVGFQSNAGKTKRRLSTRRERLARGMKENLEIKDENSAEQGVLGEVKEAEHVKEQKRAEPSVSWCAAVS